MILLIIGIIVLGLAGYFHYQARIDHVQHIVQALVWKALSVTFANMNESDDAVETATKTIDLFRHDMELLNKISIPQLLFGDIPSLLSVEAQKAINEYTLAINTTKVK